MDESLTGRKTISKEAATAAGSATTPGGRNPKRICPVEPEEYGAKF